MIFADRAEAGRRLAKRLAVLALDKPLVVALPRGGVPVGAEIAEALAAPLDVAFVRKIGAPNEPELAIGAVADGTHPEIVLNARLVAELNPGEDYIARRAAEELTAIAQRRRRYAVVRPDVSPEGRAVILVDDGVATGMTMQAALRALRQQNPGRLIVAAPVASREAVAMLKVEADDVVVLSSPRQFGSVGSFYRQFAQVPDREVAQLLEAAAERMRAGAPLSPD